MKTKGGDVMQSFGWHDRERATGTAQELVDLLLSYSLLHKASDIHIEPLDDVLRARCRIDGVLHVVGTLPKEKAEAVLIRLKIMAALDIANKRQPQDGRMLWRQDGRNIDLRLSTMPTVRGEKAVIRILGENAPDLRLDGLGLQEKAIRLIRRIIGGKNGLFLVCGPTGSGKTTTLYAALREIAADDVSIATLEDPVEYKCDGFCQSQINPKGGVEFHNGLRALLRQDPDILVVGEIRDAETAAIAVRAALTGHLVFSTLHTSSALDVPGRLVDMGVEAYLVADALIGVTAQRLVRRLCTDCAGKGCDACHGSGYRGRICLAEVVPVGKALRKVIRNMGGAEEMKRTAAEDVLFFDDAVRQALNEAVTTEAEIHRVYTE